MKSVICSVLVILCLAVTACAEVGAASEMTTVVESNLDGAGSTPLALPIHPATGRVDEMTSSSSTFDGSRWHLGTTAVYFPVPTIVGDSVNAWRVSLLREVSGSRTQVQIVRIDEATGLYIPEGPAVTADGSYGTGAFVVGAKMPPITVQTGTALSLRVTGIIEGDMVIGADAFGSRAAAVPLTHVILGPTTVRPRVASTEFLGGWWMLDQATPELFFPVSVPVGCSIQKWGVHVTKGWVTSTLRASLQRTFYSGPFDVGPVLDVTGRAGLIHMIGPELSHAVMDQFSYAIRVWRDTTVVSDDAIWFAEIWYLC